MLFHKVKGRKWYKLQDKRRSVIAYRIDVMGNFIYAEYWNGYYSKGGYKFGRLGETISSVLGKKQQEKSLSVLGWVLLYLVNFIDFTTWFKGGHCKYWIQMEKQINKF